MTSAVYTSITQNRSAVPIIAAAFVVGLMRFATAPRGFWRADEILLADALLTFDGAGVSPVVVGPARLLNVFIRDPLTTLVALSVIASVIAALLFGLAAQRILGNPTAAVAAVLVAFLSPAMLVFGALPNGVSVGVAWAAAACFFVSRREWGWFAIAAVAAFASQPLQALEFRPELAVRFIAHPWGNKFLSVPVIVAAAVGVIRLRQPALLAFGAVYTVVCLVAAPATNGVQPIVPVMPVVALFAVASVARWPAILMALPVAFVVYSWPAIDERRRYEAPAVQAVRDAARDLVITAPDLQPFGGRESGRRPGTEMLVHGRSPVPGARTYGFPARDVCRKLKGGRFHEVSLVPRPEYTVRRGVYGIESSPEHGEWRWLAKQAVIDLPEEAAVALRFRLPEDSPVDRNRLSVGGATVEVVRGSTAELALPAMTRLVIEADRTFTADGRELSVQLIGVRSSIFSFSTSGSAW